MDKNIFLTGATGALGKGLLEQLLTTTEHRLFVLVRNGSQSASQRVGKILAARSLERYAHRVHVLEGDITKPDFGLEPNAVGTLTREVDVFLHVAALTALNGHQEECFAINDEGTGNALTLAWKFYRDGRLERFCYFSTAYVGGSQQEYCALEDSLPEHPAHANYYEASKFAAETRARAAMGQGLPVTIFRPSIVVGSSVTGEVSEFNVIYPFMRLFAQGVITRLPTNPENSFNIVPIDFVVRAALAIAWQAASLGKSFHLVTESPPTIQTLIETAHDEYPQLPEVEIVPLASFDKRTLCIQDRFVLETMEPYLGYLNGHLSFDCRNTKEALNGTGIPLPITDAAFLRKLLHYAVDVGYLVL